MIRINLLFVGDATDGPTEELIPIDSLDAAWRLFGGYEYEYTTISSGQTAHTLGQLPWAGEVTPLQIDSDGALFPLRLFEFAVSGAILSWTSLGYSTSAVFRYATPPGATSLLKGILASRKVPLAVHAIRLGGIQASAQAGALTFYSRYAGTRYNGITLAITSGGTVTITPSGGVGRNKFYQVANDLDLYELLRNETQKGFQGFYLKGTLSRSSLTVPAGTYILTGGTNGGFTADLFDQFLNNWDISGVDVICPVGLLTTELSGAGTITTLALNDYPTLVVAQAPPSGVALSGIVINSKNVCSVAFQLTYDLGLPKERVDDGAPVVAAIIGSDIFNLTLAPLPEFPATPKYDQLGLHTLAASGYTTAFRSISKDWALWHVTTGDPEWPVSQYRALQEIARVAFESLEPTIGNVVIDKSDLDELLSDGFQAVVGSRIVDWTLQLQGNILYLDISFIPYGEIKVVRAQIAVGQPQAVSPV